MAVESSGAGVTICEEVDASSGIAASPGESSGMAASPGESSGIATSPGESSDVAASAGGGCLTSGEVKIPSKSAAIEFITETTCAICLAQFQGLFNGIHGQVDLGPNLRYDSHLPRSIPRSV